MLKTDHKPLRLSRRQLVGLGLAAAATLPAQTSYPDVEAFPSSTSLYPGQSLSIHTRAAGPIPLPFRLEIWRKGATDQLMRRANGTAQPAASPETEDQFTHGLPWQPAYTLTIPSNWRSGVYVAQVTGPSGRVSVASFVVKRLGSGPFPYVVSFPLNTLQAYNTCEGRGRCLYDYTRDGQYVPASTRVSFNRPGWNAGEWGESIAWFDANYPDASYATSIDLHADPNYIGRHRLMVTLWHDEYWSKEMRDQLERYLYVGGNCAVLSGNTCWWQVRFEDSNRTMVCSKSNNPADSPADPSRVTGNWYVSPPGRPEEYTIGLSFRYGALVGTRPIPDSSFQVHNPAHWSLSGTGLTTNSRFGSSQDYVGAPPVVGYESDGIDIFGQMRTFYSERWGDNALLGGWTDPNDRQFVGDFLGLGYDQVLFLNTSPGGGHVMILDYQTTPNLPTLRYWITWNTIEDQLLGGWHDPEDIILAGKFKNRPYHQLLFINNSPGGGGHVMIVDFKANPSRIELAYWQTYGSDSLLGGWHQHPEDVIKAGDFLQLGYDQVIFFNNSGTGGQVLIADFNTLPNRPNPRYWRWWGSLPELAGLSNSSDSVLTGDYLRRGYRQVAFVRRGTNPCAVLIADFKRLTPEGKPQMIDYSGQITAMLDGMGRSSDIIRSGSFRTTNVPDGQGGVSPTNVDQLCFVNRVRNTGSRVVVVSFDENGYAHTIYKEPWGDSELLSGWEHSDAVILSGRFFLAYSFAQLLFINTHADGGGHVMIVGTYKTIPDHTKLRDANLRSRVEVIAHADLWEHQWDPASHMHPVGNAAIIVFRFNAQIAAPNRGLVFNCGVTDWIGRLRRDLPANDVIQQITRNVIRYLSSS